MITKKLLEELGENERFDFYADDCKEAIIRQGLKNDYLVVSTCTETDKLVFRAILSKGNVVKRYKKFKAGEVITIKPKLGLNLREY